MCSSKSFSSKLFSISLFSFSSFSPILSLVTNFKGPLGSKPPPSIINALNCIESDIALEDIEEEFTRDYRDIFTNISTIIAKLLTKSKNENLDDNSLLQIVNVDPTRIISSYKAYCNYRILDDKLNNKLSRKFGGYGFAMIFGFYKKKRYVVKG